MVGVVIDGLEPISDFINVYSILGLFFITLPESVYYSNRSVDTGVMGSPVMVDWNPVVNLSSVLFHVTGKFNRWETQNQYYLFQ